MTSSSCPGSETPDLVLDAPAKINLHLRALGRRADGYTEILTVFQTVSLSDTLRFYRRPASLEVRCDHPLVPGGEENLAHRAATLFYAQAGLSPAMAISIEKAIPLAAGLGGGSSDAAAVLAGLNVLSGYPFDTTALAALGARLGSDVPYFLLCGTAIGRGRGEILEALTDLPAMPVVIVWPGVGSDTKTAYADLPPILTAESREDRLVLDLLRQGDLLAAVPHFVNDLEPGCVARHPEVGQALCALHATRPICAAMSGSGSSSFAIYERAAEAQAAAEHLRGRSGWIVMYCGLASRNS